MNKYFRKRILGFTIIELMIVLIIVAILLALAYPSYIDYVRKSKRGDAQQALMNWSVNQEIWRSNQSSYNGITDTGDANYIVPNTDNYDFAPSDISPTAYTLTASAKDGNDQENDEARDGSPCNTLTLDQSGQKLPAPCWE